MRRPFDLNAMGLSAGVAWVLGLSPLLVCLCLGATLINLTTDKPGLVSAVDKLNPAMVALLYLAAGILWTPPTTESPMFLSAYIFVLIAVYIFARGTAALLGGWLGATDLGGSMRRDLGRGLQGQGQVALALAVSYRMVDQGPVSDLVFTTILASIICSDLWAPRMLKGLLIDCGEISAKRSLSRREE